MKKIWLNQREFVDIKPDKRTISNEIATRQASFDFYNVLNYLPNPDPILKKQGKDIKVYREIIKDAHLGCVAGQRKAGTLSREWAIDRGKAKSKQAKAIESIFNDLDMNRIICEILDAPLFGYQPLEIMWKNDGGLIIPKDIIGKPPEWFMFDNNNELLFKSKQNMMGEALPPKKFLIPRYNASYVNPYGEGLLSLCFWPVTFKKGGLKFWVMFTEKYGMPFIIAKQPRGTPPDETEKTIAMLEDMVQDAIAVIPDDCELQIETFSDKGASTNTYKELISAMEADISKAIVGQTLTSQQGEVGSQALGKVHMDVREDIIESDVKIVESTINQVISWIFELNWGSGQHPIFSMWREEEIDDALAKRDETLTRTGVKFTKSYYVKNYGFEEEDFDIEATPAINPKTPENTKQFSEAGAVPFPDQQAVDDIEISPQRLQEQMQGILKPIIDLINQGTDYMDVVGKLADTFPELDTKALENMLQRAIFVSEMWGRLNAEKE